MLKDSIEFIKLNKWLFVLIISIPIIINYGLMTWHFWGVNGELGDWLGFLSNYSGGIIGGIVAYKIAKYQIDHEKEERKKSEIEKEEFAYTLIQTFLFEELRANLNKIPQSVMSALLERGSGRQLDYEQLVGNVNFTYNIYNEVKFEIVKYNHEVVSKTIKVYHLLKQFETIDKINNLPQVDALTYFNNFNYWKERL